MKKWNIGWGTVSSCNMNCLFCYSKDKRKHSNDLSFSEWKQFIDENHSRIYTINYGTGENTLSREWFELVGYIRQNYPEIRQALTTNGYLSEAVKDEECLRIFKKSIDEVDISLDFCTEEEHCRFRGQPNAFRWALQTLALCREYKKSATIVFLGSEKTLGHQNIDGLFAIAREYNAILRMNMYRPTEGINEISEEFIVSYDTFVDTLRYISKTQTILSVNDALFSSILTNKTVNDPSGERSIRILADGNITPSTYLIQNDFIVANITEPNVLERLENEELLSNIINKEVPAECNECIYADSCEGGVYDRRYLWYGTLAQKDPYCPHIFTEPPTDQIIIEKTNFISVHDGYLPTIFFKPKEKENETV